MPPQLREQIVAAMAKYHDRRSAAIPALHAAQEVHGWCSPEAIEQVAAVMQLTPAYLTSVATFYDMLETHPKPRHDVYVCTNISCSLRGADEFFEAMEEAAADAIDINVRSFECLGACDIAPMASVDGEYVGPLVPADAGRIVEDIHAGRAGAPGQAAALPAVRGPGVSSGGRGVRSAAARRPPRRHRRPAPRGVRRTPGSVGAIEVPTDEPSPSPPQTSVPTPSRSHGTPRTTPEERP